MTDVVAFGKTFEHIQVPSDQFRLAIDTIPGLVWTSPGRVHRFPEPALAGIHRPDTHKRRAAGAGNRRYALRTSPDWWTYWRSILASGSPGRDRGPAPAPRRGGSLVPVPGGAAVR